MSTIHDMLLRWQAINVPEMVNTILETSEAKNAIILKNQENMSKGLLSDNTPTGQYINPYYAKKKSAMNPGADGNRDAFLTGNFYNNQFVEITNGAFRIESTVEYNDRLNELMGDNLQRLSDDSKAKINEMVVTPNIIAAIRELVKL